MRTLLRNLTDGKGPWRELAREPFHGEHADNTSPSLTVAHHLDDLTEALWTTAEGLGDSDTTCAIPGGAVAARAGVFRAWPDRRSGMRAVTGDGTHPT